jgi:hypothetical protein
MVFYCFLLARYDKFKSLKKSEKSVCGRLGQRKERKKTGRVRKETMVFDANTGKNIHTRAWIYNNWIDRIVEGNFLDIKKR